MLAEVCLQRLLGHKEKLGATFILSGDKPEESLPWAGHGLGARGGGQAYDGLLVFTIDVIIKQKTFERSLMCLFMSPNLSGSKRPS